MTLAEYPVDWLLKGEPRQAQIEALRRSYYGYALHNRNPDIHDLDDPAPQVLREGWAKGWGHFLQMRVGKTPVLLNEFMLFRRDEGIKHMVVFAPAKFKYDWPLEAERFGVDVPALAFESRDRDAAWNFWRKNPNGGLICLNYEALQYKETQAFLEEVCCDTTMIAADESIELKNFSAKRSPIAVDMAKRCGVRRVLSGKPVTQGPQDLWAQLRFISAISGINPITWRNTYCRMGGFKGKKIIGTRPEMEGQLRELLEGCSWVARRKDWMITPGVDYAERMLRLTDEQLVHYNRLQKDFLTELESGQLVAAEQIITRLIKQTQVSSGFLIDENHVSHLLVPPDRNPKVVEIRNMLENEIECKVIVVCVHVTLIRLLAEALAEYNPAVIYRDVDVVAEKAKFNNDRSCRIMIGQENAIKYGHTLMGNPDDPCYAIIFAENNYSLNDRSQCEERPQGEGQQYPISVFDFAATPVDLAPIRALQRKEDIASACLGYARGEGILPRPELKES